MKKLYHCIRINYETTSRWLGRDDRGWVTTSQHNPIKVVFNTVEGVEKALQGFITQWISIYNSAPPELVIESFLAEDPGPFTWDDVPQSMRPTAWERLLEDD